MSLKQLFKKLESVLGKGPARLLSGLLFAYISLELLAILFLGILVNFQSYQNFYKHDRPRLLSYLNWFDERYDYHPYLDYAQKNIDASIRSASMEKDNFRLAIQGGSFAMFFADFLKTPMAKKLLDQLAKDLGYPSITVVDMAGGGYRQPQQLITSGLWKDFADFFVSIEGFNEYAEKTHACLPPEWSRGGLKFNPLLNKSINAVMARFFKDLFMGLHSWSTGYDPLGKISFFLMAEPITKLYFMNESGFFDHMNESVYCKNLSDKVKASFEQQMNHRNADWEKFLKRHHQIHQDDKNLITVFQPNIHFSKSKPLSPGELELLAGKKFGFVDREYPQGRQMFSRLNEEGYAVYDLTMIFANNPNTLYKDNCCHVNDEGNRLFLKEVIPLIKKHYNAQTIKR